MDSLIQINHPAPDFELPDLYSAVTAPHFFDIDEKGVLRYRGAPDDTSFRQREPTAHYLKDAVEALLNGRDPNPAETAGYGCAIVRHSP
jgi:hypothetical protein